MKSSTAFVTGSKFVKPSFVRSSGCSSRYFCNACWPELLPPNRMIPSEFARGLMEYKAPPGQSTPYEFSNALVPDQDRGGITLLHLGICQIPRIVKQGTGTHIWGVGLMVFLNSGSRAEAYAFVACTTVGVVIDPRSVATTHFPETPDKATELTGVQVWRLRPLDKQVVIIWATSFQG